MNKIPAVIPLEKVLGSHIKTNAYVITKTGEVYSRICTSGPLVNVLVGDGYSSTSNVIKMVIRLSGSKSGSGVRYAFKNNSSYVSGYSDQELMNSVHSGNLVWPVNPNDFKFETYPVRSATSVVQSVAPLAPTVTGQWYVAAIENGVPKFSQVPFCHKTETDACTEASRLAKITPSNIFGVFKLASSVKAVGVEWTQH